MTLTIERIEMNKSSINIDEIDYAFANHYESERKKIFFEHFKIIIVTIVLYLLENILQFLKMIVIILAKDLLNLFHLICRLK